MFDFTYTQGYQESRLCQELDDHFQLLHKEFKETKVGVLVVAVDQERSSLRTRIARLNPPQVFYRFGFPGLSYHCVIYFLHCFNDMIYLC